MTACSQALPDSRDADMVRKPQDGPWGGHTTCDKRVQSTARAWLRSCHNFDSEGTPIAKKLPKRVQGGHITRGTFRQTWLLASVAHATGLAY